MRAAACLVGLPAEKREGLFFANGTVSVDRSAGEWTVGNNMSVARGIPGEHITFDLCSCKVSQGFLVEHQFIQLLCIFHWDLLANAVRIICFF